MKELRKFYLAGVFTNNEYSERFEKIIEAESLNKAKEKLTKSLSKNMIILIDECYETSDDAII